MKRIECENEGCTQTLGPTDVECDRCGRQQTTRGWAFVLALVYYPVLSALLGLALLTVVGLAFAGTPPPAALVATGLAAAAVYARLALGAYRRYRRRRRRLERAPEVESYE